MATEDRLDSWKDIARYLDRSVKTVQRWEREEHLPVHRRRVPDGAPTRRSARQVFAYKAEIDGWWEGYRTRERPPGQGFAGFAPRRWQAVTVTLLVAGLVLAAAELAT